MNGHARVMEWGLTPKCGPVALLCVLALCLTLVPGTAAVAVKPADGGATFDMYSMYPEQMLSPATGSLGTFMPVEARNIADRGSGAVSVTAECDSRYFSAEVKPSLLTPRGEDGVARSTVLVSCEERTPEGTVCWIKVTGARGQERHRIWLKVTALASKPYMEFSRGAPFSGPGYKDQETQLYVGRPVTWHVLARNDGGAEDVFRLGYESSFPCDVTFRSLAGERLKEVKLKGKTRNLLYARPCELAVTVVPRGRLNRNQPATLTVKLGPGGHTGETARLDMKLLDPGMLFCANALDGARPHPHQVMPNEATTFVFHVSNTGGRRKDVRLSAAGDTARWRARLGTEEIKGLEPGATADAVLAMTAPGDAVTGERAEFTVTAESGGCSEQVKVAAEVTDQRNIYFWSVDSMDPEYLDLNREGTGKGSEGDWLMPNTRTFMSGATSYSGARTYLPSATDMNHTNALAGTYTGTQGVYMVGGTFKGFTEHDEVLSGNNTMSLMRYGPEGRPVERIFEVAKAQSGGKALTGFWTNKNWLAELEGERSVDIVGHSERWPLFFEPPYKYKAAGDPSTDDNPADPLSPSVSACFHSSDPRAVILPTILGQFDLYYGFRLLNTPVALVFGSTPGMHEEDNYIYESFARSVAEEDPDVSYVNVADLDNTGHFTGASWMTGEWEASKRGTAWDENVYSPYIRRDEALDIVREEDRLFGKFLDMLKQRGVYDNSIIVLLSDHGMENMKDSKRGYQEIDLRDILRRQGLLRFEDYNEAGGTEINLIYCGDPAKASRIKRILEDYTVDDPKLGRVKPLTVIDRREMKAGKDFGEHGKVLPGELYSEYWIDHPSPDGQVWPDLFVFPLYNYQVMAHGDALESGINNVAFDLGIHVPDSVRFGFPGAHGGLQTERMPLVFKAPAGSAAYRPGTRYAGEVRIGDIAPTIYSITGWPVPGCVDGKPLPSP